MAKAGLAYYSLPYYRQALEFLKNAGEGFVY
jgi:hypothetical protein